MKKTEAYLKAPLVELIAEVQWFVPGPIGVPQPMVFDAALYNRFALAVEELGFNNSERLFPEGFPTIAGQVVARFRERREQPPIYQIGPGIFSANGLPPTYSNWEGFAPFLFKGLQALASARLKSSEPYSFIKLRYIDAFGPEFLLDRAPQDFIEQDLGFSVKLPEAVSAIALADSSPSVAIQSASKVEHGGELQISVGQAVLDGQQKVVLDVAVTYSNVHEDETSARFDEAHEIAHSVFEGSTESIREIMRGGGQP